jgi:uncharacterized protein
VKRVFADTSYFIAVIAPNDVAHARALALADQKMRLVTTAWVMSELAAYLASSTNRPLFERTLASIRSNASADFLPASQDQFDLGAKLYTSRADKAWSLVDCISFSIMQRESLIEALTTDRHFIQAGFNALLIEGNQPSL